MRHFLAAMQTHSTCACGFDKTSKFVGAHYKYSLWGWVLLGIGITPKPIAVDYQCERCGCILESSRDPKLLERYVAR